MKDPCAALAPAITVSLPSSSARSYNIYIKNGLLPKVGELVRSVLPSKKAYVLSDDTVFGLYGETVRNSLAESGFEVYECVVPHGEASKTAENLILFLNRLAHDRITRSDCVIALGGGVIGDLAGFAAAVYLRGIPFVQIPTTLLAMVDSSVGGKTAVDLDEGKNLAGAFWQPSLVICDPDVLATLPADTFSDGCAEVIKYSMISDRALFDKLHSPISSQVNDVIRMCIADKQALVEADETDKGVRQLLNLGHTVGHAIEACSDYTISHGSAVAIGMVIITRAAEKKNICPKGTLTALINLLEAYRLPTKCDFSADALFAVATADKKRDGDHINLVVPYGISDSRLLKVPATEVLEFIKLGLGEG
ncbi:MAG: 3-dehydroquinate synthase [Ruminococcaceae bacterium]|nr:3-dehydroquinate synthase [Oscillospiraceae bacterium]